MQDTQVQIRFRVSIKSETAARGAGKVMEEPGRPFPQFSGKIFGRDLWFSPKASATGKQNGRVARFSDSRRDSRTPARNGWAGAHMVMGSINARRGASVVRQG